MCNYHTNDVAVDVAAGLFHSVAVLADGSVACWGDDSDGQCTIPPDVGTPDHPVVAVAAGHAHTVALLADGGVVCWGSNLAGQCDVPDDIGGDRRQGGRPAVAVSAYGFGSGARHAPNSSCVGDLDRDGIVDGVDLGRLLEVWNNPDPCEADLDVDGAVGSGDLGLLLANWGPCGS